MCSRGTVVLSAFRSKFFIAPFTPLFQVGAYSHVSKMPKSTKGKSGAKANNSSTQNASGTASAVVSPVVVEKNGEISISIQVKPGAKKDAVTDISENAVGIQISSPPVDGEANIAITKYFAELLRVKKTDVSLKGGKSRQKKIFVSSSAGLTSEGILALLKDEMEQK